MPTRFTPFVGISGIFAALLFCPAATAASTYVSNLAQANTVSFSALPPPNYSTASSFTTGAGTYVLTSVALRIQSNTMSGSVGVRLRANNGGQPGALLEDLGVKSLPLGASLQAFPSVGTTLAANTTYWVTAGEAGSGSVSWMGTTSTAETSPAGWTIGDQSFNTNDGVNWNPIFFGPPNESGLFSVDVTEPTPTFTDIGAGLPGVDNGSVAWGDHDNDGDLDILLTGYSSGTYISRVCRNDGGGAFNDIAAGLLGVGFSSVAWGDYDNDGDLDILLAGYGGPFICRVYRNDGGNAFNDIAAGLPGASDGSVAWGDHDNDGDLDILLTGYDGVNRISRVFRNDGGGTFHDIAAGLPGVSASSVAWGDCDNDGDLDILLTGTDGANPISRFYRNDGAGAFHDIAAGLSGVWLSSVAWGDYDNDGDLDILLTGCPAVGCTTVTMTSLVYRNGALSSNGAPSAPSNLVTTRSGGSVTFSWTGATDDHTPMAALSYNLRVGTTPEGNQVVPGMAAANGYRQVARLGNAQERTAWTLTLPAGTFYWSVQAIDGAFLGSPFAFGGQVTGLEDVSDVPSVYQLSPGNPNPFTKSTVITFALPRPGLVSILVFDAAGRKVRTLVNGPTEAGVRTVRWDARNDRGTRLAAGVYFVRFEASGITRTARLVLAE